MDRTFAYLVTDQDYGADIVNQSYGYFSWSNYHLWQQYRTQEDFWNRVDERLPRTSRAIRQDDLAEKDKILFVVSAGNDSTAHDIRTLPQPGAAMALFYPELRGLAFAVAALGTDGRIAGYSNRCGSRDRYREGRFVWDPTKHGRHYCLSAPGTVNAVAPDGKVVSVPGTSFAAPIVSGGLALMMEHFRGQMTPRQIGLRMVNTADNTGDYADVETYGSGVLDLEAAMNPVGETSTGLPGEVAAVDTTAITLPPSYGDVADRMGFAEIATFDEWNAPFWRPLGTFVSMDTERRLDPLSLAVDRP